MKKIFSLIAVMLLGATSLFAQNPDKGLSWAVEGGIGSELEIGGRAQYNFNKYVAWDVLNAKYAYDYGDFSWNELTLTTGVRGFSPTFGPDLKAFAAIGLGYGLVWKDGSDSNFALDFTIGMYVWKGLYAGYGLGFMKHDAFKHKDHLLRVGYNF